MVILQSALKQVLKIRSNRILLSGSFLIFALLYFAGIEFSVSLEMFLTANTRLFVFLQILFILINALLGSIAITFIVDVAGNRHQKEGIEIGQTFGSLGISLLTTGCYVCGSLLVPIAGISTFLGSLPFGGLEVKAATVFILFVSILDLSEKVLGTCKLERKLKVGNIVLPEIVQNGLRFMTVMVIIPTVIIITPRIISGADSPIINHPADSCPYSGEKYE